jgi:hypothetical protein
MPVAIEVIVPMVLVIGAVIHVDLAAAIGCALRCHLHNPAQKVDLASSYPDQDFSVLTSIGAGGYSQTDGDHPSLHWPERKIRGSNSHTRILA